jgi:hypothetical protein
VELAQRPLLIGDVLERVERGDEIEAPVREGELHRIRLAHGQAPVRAAEAQGLALDVDALELGAGKALGEQLEIGSGAATQVEDRARLDALAIEGRAQNAPSPPDPPVGALDLPESCVDPGVQGEPR